MGKLIWGLAEAELRIMRAAADTHSFAFPRLGENMKDLEDLERRPDHAGSKRFFFPSFSPAKKSQQKSVRGTHAFLLLATVPRQQKKLETRIFGLSRTRRIDVICKIEI